MWFQYILDNPEKGWSYSELSSNLNITWDIVKEHPEKPWRYYMLSSNPNITWDIVNCGYERKKYFGVFFRKEICSRF